jgi:hypothetical protein
MRQTPIEVVAGELIGAEVAVVVVSGAQRDALPPIGVVEQLGAQRDEVREVSLRVDDVAPVAQGNV